MINEYPKMLFRLTGGVLDRHIVHDLAGENMAAAEGGWVAKREDAKEYDPAKLKADKAKANKATAGEPAPTNEGTVVSGKANDDPAPAPAADRKTQPGMPHPPGGFKVEPTPAEDPLAPEKAQEALAKEHGTADDKAASKKAKAAKKK